MGSIVQRGLHLLLIGSATLDPMQSWESTHMRVTLVVTELLEANLLGGHLLTQVRLA